MRLMDTKRTQQPRRILLAVTGLTPQVVTETLYALACRVEESWVPHEVHLITTATGAENARLNLLSGEGWFHRLRRDYALPEIAFPGENIHILVDRAGAPLDDIRTLDQNTVAADFIVETVRQLTASPESELHVSIAGGRKTMGYYLGYALSLYGRAQDRLSHVLVSEPYETNRDFYYPTPYDHPIHGKRGDKLLTVDARNARVDLAEIPFVRLREGLPPRLREGTATFSRVVGIANRALGEPHLILDVRNCTVVLDGEAASLSHVQFAVLLWLARRAKRRLPAVDWGQDEAAMAFLGVAKQVMNPAGGEYERAEESLDWRKVAAIKLAKYFEPHKTRINKKFEALLGERAAARYAIRGVKTPQGQRYDLNLKPSQIEIIER